MKVKVSNEHQQCSKAEGALSEPALCEDTDTTISLRCDANWTPVPARSQPHRRRWRNLRTRFLVLAKLWKTSYLANKSGESEMRGKPSEPNAFPLFSSGAGNVPCLQPANGHWADRYLILTTAAGKRSTVKTTVRMKLIKAKIFPTRAHLGDWI